MFKGGRCQLGFLCIYIVGGVQIGSTGLEEYLILSLCGLGVLCGVQRGLGREEQAQQLHCTLQCKMHRVLLLVHFSQWLD